MKKRLPGRLLILERWVWGALLGFTAGGLLHALVSDTIGVGPQRPWDLRAISFFACALLGAWCGAHRMSARVRRVRHELCKPVGGRDPRVIEDWLARLRS